jgi:hypothetical protein
MLDTAWGIVTGLYCHLLVYYRTVSGSISIDLSVINVCVVCFTMTSLSLMYGFEWYDYWWIMNLKKKNFKWSHRGVFGVLSQHYRQDCEIPCNASVRISDIHNLPNSSLVTVDYIHGLMISIWLVYSVPLSIPTAATVMENEKHLSSWERNAWRWK